MRNSLEVKFIIALVAILVIFSFVGMPEAEVAAGEININNSNNNSTKTIKDFLSDADFYFIAAGHLYGYNPANTLGIHPPFYERLKTGEFKDAAFMVFLGDIVKSSNRKLWGIVDDQLKEIGIKTYFVMGNHDNDREGYGMNYVKEKFGAPFFSFYYDDQLFIVFNTQLEPGQVPAEQIKMLKHELKKHPKAKNVFLFIHELLWLADNKIFDEKYRGIACNRYYLREFESNFWPELYPLLKSYKDRNFLIVTGDVGALPTVIPAFYEDLGNVKLIATGMGIGDEQNFLLVKVKDGKMFLKLATVNPDIELNLKDYEYKAGQPLNPMLKHGDRAKIFANKPDPNQVQIVNTQSTHVNNAIQQGLTEQQKVHKPQQQPASSEPEDIVVFKKPPIKFAAGKNVSEKAVSLAESAQQQLKSKNYDQAITLFKQALAVTPDYRKAVEGLAISYKEQADIQYKQKDYNKALELYNKALQTNPHYANAIRGVSRCYCRKGDLALKGDDFETAVTLYTNAIKIRPNYLEPNKRKAQALFGLGKYDEAKKYVEKTKQLSPDNEASWVDEMNKRIANLKSKNQ